MSLTLDDCFKSQNNFGKGKNKGIFIPVLACFDRKISSKNEACGQEMKEDLLVKTAEPQYHSITSLSSWQFLSQKQDNTP